MGTVVGEAVSLSIHGIQEQVIHTDMESNNQRYERIANLLSPVVGVIKDGNIDEYSRDPEALIDYLIDELQRMHKNHRNNH